MSYTSLYHNFYADDDAIWFCTSAKYLCSDHPNQLDIRCNAKKSSYYIGPTLLKMGKSTAELSG